MVAHRRSGKTVATVNDTISRIMRFTTDHLPQPAPPGRFAYIAPFYSQAKAIAWEYAKMYTKGLLAKPPSEGELSVTLFNQAKFQLFGADNPDALRGSYFDGVVLDEYGQMRPSVWSQAVLPTLVDRKGWATFIGTPNGPNHFRDLSLHAQRHPHEWFFGRYPASQTGLIAENELDEFRKIMLPEEYEQEFECSFEAATRGAFYASEIGIAERSGRVAATSANPDLPLHFVFDLGYRDDTAIIGFQQALDGYPILWARAYNLKPIRFYIDLLPQIAEEIGALGVGEVWLPHDAKAKSLQTGRSIIEQFLASGIRPELVPDLDVMDGIAAARLLFPEIFFNEPQTTDLVTALKSYRREYDELKKVFRDKPLHDWSSHYADVFRYFALVTQKRKVPTGRRPHSPFSLLPREQLMHLPTPRYPVTLDDLWEEYDGRVRSSRIN